MRDRNVEYSRGLIVRRGLMAFVRRDYEDGVSGPMLNVRFEREVLTMRETSSTLQWVMTEDGAIIKRGETHNDYYGILTSPSDLIETARKDAAKGKIGPDMPFRIEVLTTVEESLRRPAPEGSFDPKWAGSRTAILPIPKEWMIDDDQTRRAVEDQEAGKPWDDREAFHYPRTTEETFTVWRSDWSEEENAAALAAVREKVGGPAAAEAAS